MSIRPLAWSNPRTLAEAVAQIGPNNVPKAGGVELMDLLKEGLVEPERLVNLRAVPGLDRIEDTPQGLRLGPLVTLARLADDAGVRARWPVLAEAAGRAATPQIRNMATLGGNLLQRPHCWYFRSEQFPCLRKGGGRCFAHDGENALHAVFANRSCCAVHPSSLATALLAIGAGVELMSPRGARAVPLEQFYVPAEEVRTRDTVRQDDELVTAVVLRAPTPGGVSAYVKQAQKESYDWPLVEVAVVLDLGPKENKGPAGSKRADPNENERPAGSKRADPNENERPGGACSHASIVLGAVAPTPWRARAAEAAIVGRPIDEASARDAGKAALQGAAPLRDNGYKLALIEVAVRRAILATAAQPRG
jgi:xanthine dehydrogenase YagS FAD-binding subunit